MVMMKSVTILTDEISFGVNHVNSNFCLQIYI